jgi:hypothetical protein
MDWERLNLALNTFNPYTCIYLNEKIPLEEFVDYIEIFEDLVFRTSQKEYQNLPFSGDEILRRSRLDRELLQKFKAEKRTAKNYSRQKAN